MREVFSILFGAVFTISVSVALGALLLYRLRVSLYREEAALFAFVTGAALLSFAIFLLCVLHIAYPAVFLTGGIVAVVWAFSRARGAFSHSGLPAAPRYWNLLFLAIFGAFFILYFFNALAPEVSSDGSGYHLANVARFREHHSFVWDHHSMTSYFPQALEMVFLVAFAFGRHSAAALIHFAFFITLALLVACYGRRSGFPGVGCFAALVVWVSPVAGKAGTSAYNDLAAATAIFAVFYLLQVWDETREDNLLILAGLAAGFAYGVKYTAAIALPFAAAMVWWRLRHDTRRWRALAIVSSSSALMILPWVVRNWIWLGNPFSPFLNRWFPNPFYYPGPEQSFLADRRVYVGVHDWWQIPWRHIVSGEGVNGMVGVLFLLSPLALLALRKATGRRILLGALIFGLPAAFNSDTRLLVPALPLVALALGQALAAPRMLLPLLAAGQALINWPSVLSLYCHRYSWRLESIPMAAALRLEPESAFLSRYLEDYALKPVLETTTPPDATILTLSGRENAYIDRSIVPFYVFAQGNLAWELLRTPVIPGYQPTRRQHFHFAPVMARSVRVVETTSANAFWTITEMRVFSQGREVTRSPDWRITAEPNPLQVAMAFDNNYATRWSSWQKMSPGMFVAIDFGSTQTIDEVVCEMTPAPEPRMQVEAAASDGRWTTLNSTTEQESITPPSGLRYQAASAIKANGISYILVHDGDLLSDDLRDKLHFWGMTEVGRTGAFHLYRIDE